MKCFYHSTDLDGHCSGAIVKYRYPECEMHPINYGDEFPWKEIKKGEEVYMVDFCLQPFDGMERLVRSSKVVIWIDHHSSAIKAHDEYENKNSLWLGMPGKRDTAQAACELTWEYLFPDKPVPLAVKILSLYDSWTYQGHELESLVLPFQIRMRVEDLDPKNWEISKHVWRSFFAGPTENDSIWDNSRSIPWAGAIRNYIQEGKLILRYDEEQKCRYAQAYAFETILKDPRGDDHGHFDWPLKAIAVNLGLTNSKVFDSVWDDSKYDLMITFCRRKDKLWNVSLYSTKIEVDCGEIAKSFGGGGHEGAAGFQCNELPFEY